MIKFGDPQVGNEEIELIKSVFETKVFVHGPFTEKFENDFQSKFGYRYAVSVSNCTAGLHLAHFSLNKNKAKTDRNVAEVICPAMTHVATAHAIELSGLKPIFIDCNSEDGNIDVDLVEAAVTENTAGIAAMHFNGIPCDILRLMEIANNNDLYVVEDCAISLGAKVNGRPIGSFGNAGVFSFHPVKQMTTGEGGIIVVNNSEFSDELKLERAFGVDRNFGERKQAGVYDVPMLGFNYRMAEIPAAIGVVQVAKFENLESIRKRNYRFLNAAISKISGMTVLGNALSDDRAYYCLIAQIDGTKLQRDKIAAELKSRGIQTSVYYPHPVPRLSYYANKYEFSEDIFANSIGISDRSIAFSIGAHLELEDLGDLVKTLSGSI